VGFIPITAVQIDIPDTAGGWRDLDLSAYIPDGANGIVGNNSVNAGGVGYGYRRKGSTDNRYDRCSGDRLTGIFVGCDTNRVIQYSNSEATHHRLYLLGYTLPGDIVIATNCTNISPGAPFGVWTDVDLSALCPGAIAVIVEVFNTSVGHLEWGIRMKGSVDNRIGNTYGHNVHDVLIGCDASQVIQVWQEAGNVNYFLRGYITHYASFYADGIEHTPAGAGAWTDADLGGERLVEGYRNVAGAHYYLEGIVHNKLASFEIIDEITSGGIRKNGETLDMRGIFEHSWIFSVTDYPESIEGQSNPVSRR